MIDLNAKAFDLDSLINNPKSDKKDNTPPEQKKEKQEKTQNFDKKENQKIEKTVENNQTKQIQKKENSTIKPNNTIEINKEKTKEINKEKTKQNQNTTSIPQDKLDKKIEEKKEIPIDNRLIIGQMDKFKDYFINENIRYLNMAIIGNKGTGKTTNLLPFFAEQDISKKLAGATFIVSDKEMAYGLYSLCKQYKRKVHLLKPSTNNEISNKFLWKTEYNYDYINEHIINYKDAIRRKEIVIIDMEVFKYKIDAIRATSMLLLQLRLDLADTDITQRNAHFLYVDDAFYYMRFLEDFLRYGSTYHLGTILFLESRSQLKNNDKDLRDILDNNVRTYLLANKLTVDDYSYYNNLFTDKNFENLRLKEKNTFLCQTLDQKGSLRASFLKIKQINTINLEELEKKSKKIRTSLLKEKRKERENEIRSKMENSQFSSEPKPIDNKLLESLIKEDNPTIPLVVKKTQEEIEMENKQIRENIIEEEKINKRKAAENIYNNYEKHIEFCDDLFKFD